jgi:hypothetical protein
MTDVDGNEVVSEENYGYAQDDLSPPMDLSGVDNPVWRDSREPVGFASPTEVARSYSNSMADRGRGRELGSSNVWEQTSANILQAVAQTGINVYAQRNGVYSSQLPQNTQSNASPRQKQQSQQPMLMLALIIGAIYVMGK